MEVIPNSKIDISVTNEHKNNTHITNFYTSVHKKGERRRYKWVEKNCTSIHLLVSFFINDKDLS